VCEAHAIIACKEEFRVRRRSPAAGRSMNAERAAERVFQLSPRHAFTCWVGPWCATEMGIGFQSLPDATDNYKRLLLPRQNQGTRR
jgi:hypothetical protein